MAKSRRESNGKPSNLDEALSALIHAQATMVQNQAAFQSQIIDIERLNTERFGQIEQRFARIEAILLDHSRILGEHSRILADHSRILADHGRILQALPEAIRDKIGFKIPEST